MSINKYTTSQGHDFSTGEWLDLHFDACESEYENMVRAIGIQPGWEILDAGCGNGRFLNILSKQVTPQGKIEAIDLAQENVDAVNDAVKSNCFQTSISVSIGDITKLEFPDDSFDLVWCANVTQYLNEVSLSKAMKQFQRVLKPNGILAVKETDASSYFFHPTKNVNLLWDSVKKMNNYDRQRWFIHPIEMKNILQKHGFKNVSQSTHIIERRFPLDEKSLKYLTKLFDLQDVSWSKIDLQTQDNQQEWKKIIDKSSPDYILVHPNFYWREGHIVAIGKKE